MRDRRWLAAALFALVTAVYLPSVRNGFIYDDHIIIIRQPRADSLSSLLHVFREQHFPGLPYYRPVTRFTLLAQKTLHGDDPAPFHAFNAALMGATAAAAFLLLTGPPFALSRSAAFLAAVVFALHPASSSTVFPVCSGRETLLPAFFGLLALSAHLRAGRGWRSAAALFFALALFSKEQMVVLPVVFVLADVLQLSAAGPGRSPRRWAARYAPLVAVAAAYAAARYSLFHADELTILSTDRPWLPPLSYVYAVQVFFVPFLNLVYEPPVDVWFSAARAIPALLAAALLIGGVVVRRDRIGKTALFWLGWFVLVQLPTANIFLQEAPFDERYVFLGILGIVAPAAALLEARTGGLPGRRVIPAVTALTVVALGVVSQVRSSQFRDDFSFSRRWVETNPAAKVARNNYGAALAMRGRYAEAEEQQRAAIRLDPAYAHARTDLALALQAQGRVAEAIEEFEASVRIDPNDAFARLGYGNALAALGRPDDAARQYATALQIEPGYADAHNNLGNVHLGRGNEELALTAFREALAIDPEHAEASFNLSGILLRRGRVAEALGHLRSALQASPENPLILDRLARVLATAPDPGLRDVRQAVKLAEQACAITGHADARMLSTLAAAYAASGDRVRARETARAALQLALAAGDAPFAEELQNQIRGYGGAGS